MEVPTYRKHRDLSFSPKWLKVIFDLKTHCLLAWTYSLTCRRLFGGRERYVLQVLCLHENIDVKAYIPIGSMGLVFFSLDGWLIFISFMVNVGKYNIHGSIGYVKVIVTLYGHGTREKLEWWVWKFDNHLSVPKSDISISSGKHWVKWAAP